MEGIFGCDLAECVLLLRAVKLCFENHILKASCHVFNLHENPFLVVC